MGETLVVRAREYVSEKYLSTVNGDVITRLLSQTLHRKPDPFEIAYTAIAYEQECKVKRKLRYIYTSCSYLYSRFTGEEPEQYFHRGTRLMSLLKKAYQMPLIHHGVIASHSLKYVCVGDETKARSLRLTKHFLERLELALMTEVQYGKVLPRFFCDKPAKRTTLGEGWNSKNMKRMHPNLQATFEKLKQSTFLIDVEKVNAIYDARSLIMDEKGTYKLERLDSIRFGLSTVALVDTPQHHDAIHLQMSGRRHTVGGLQAIPKEVRRMILKPLNPTDVLIDFDLESCQLMLGAKALNANAADTKLTNILEQGKSIWKTMQESGINVSKAHLKKAVYAMLFMCNKQGIVATVADNMGDALFTKDHLEKLICFLEDLYPKRKEWQQIHKPETIINHVGEKNLLGLSFQMEEQYKRGFRGDIYSELYEKFNAKNPQAMYAAWQMQSLEQWIITSLIKEKVTFPVVCDCHDGFLLSIPKDEVHTATRAYRAFLKDNFGIYLKGEVWEDGQVIPVDEYLAGDEQSIVLPLLTFQSGNSTFAGGMTC